MASIIPITKIYPRTLTTITDTAILSPKHGDHLNGARIGLFAPWPHGLVSSFQRIRQVFAEHFSGPFTIRALYFASKTLADRQRRAIISALHMLREVVRFCFHDDDDDRIITENQQIVEMAISSNLLYVCYFRCARRVWRFLFKCASVI